MAFAVPGASMCSWSRPCVPHRKIKSAVAFFGRVWKRIDIMRKNFLLR
jgi:hypothetical protein